MTKKLFDYFFSIIFIILLLPLMIIISLVILIFDGSPIFYIAKRIGYKRKSINMIKFRTMSLSQDNNSTITAHNDDRIYPLGKILRLLNIDDMPQLFNILQGEMSFIGPRPEDPWIVEKYYSKNQLQTFNVLPGLVSPGSIFNYTHGERILGKNNTESNYVNRLMHIKLDMDIIYIENASFMYDIKMIIRTLVVIIMKTLGKRHFNYPPEYYMAISKHKKEPLPY